MRLRYLKTLKAIHRESFKDFLIYYEMLSKIASSKNGKTLKTLWELICGASRFKTSSKTFIIKEKK